MMGRQSWRYDEQVSMDGFVKFAARVVSRWQDLELAVWEQKWVSVAVGQA